MNKNEKMGVNGVKLFVYLFYLKIGFKKIGKNILGKKGELFCSVHSFFSTVRILKNSSKMAKKWLKMNNKVWPVKGFEIGIINIE